MLPSSAHSHSLSLLALYLDLLFLVPLCSHWMLSNRRRTITTTATSKIIIRTTCVYDWYQSFRTFMHSTHELFWARKKKKFRRFRFFYFFFFVFSSSHFSFCFVFYFFRFHFFIDENEEVSILCRVEHILCVSSDGQLLFRFSVSAFVFVRVDKYRRESCERGPI